MLAVSSLCVLAVTISFFVHHTCAQNSNYIGPFEEARYIVLDATDALLPDPNMVIDVAKAIVIIRAHYRQVAKVRNNGVWFLGKLRIHNYDKETFTKLQSSEYGPVETVSDGEDNTTIVTFTKPYNPKILSQRLLVEMGINSDPVWKTGPDYGQIVYIIEKHQYIFRQGLANCGDNCDRNRFWVFHFENDQATLVSEYLTGIPIINRPKKPIYGNE